LKLKYDELLSSFAFSFHLRRYSQQRLYTEEIAGVLELHEPFLKARRCRLP
jgi:hypothetical protein